MIQIATYTATGLVALGAVFAWWFVLQYRRYDYRGTPEGRLLMNDTLMIAIILSLATEVRIFGPYPGIQFVAVALYAWLVWLLGTRVRLMRNANRGEKR